MEIAAGLFVRARGGGGGGMCKKCVHHEWIYECEYKTERKGIGSLFTAG